MANIPTGGITIDNLPSASGVNDGDAVVISRDGKTYKSTAIAEQVNTLNADLTDIAGIYFSDWNTFVSYASSLPVNSTRLFSTNSSIGNILTGQSSGARGILFTQDSSFMYMTFRPSNGTIAIGQYNYSSETMTYLYRFTGTSVSTASINPTSEDE